MQIRRLRLTLASRFDLQDLEFDVVALADASTQQLQRARIQLAGLLVRPDPRVDRALAHQRAVADRLLDRGGLLVRERLAGDEVDGFQKRFVLVFGGEVFAVVGQMIGTDHDLGEKRRRQGSTLAMAEAVSSTGSALREGISITAVVWSMPCR